MFRSIRWQLVLTYLLLTLLAVGLVGVLGLSLVRRYTGQQEIAYLSANADAVAQQAQSLIWPVVQQNELQKLALTSSFLGNARVRILDGDRHVVADSGSEVQGQEFVWVLTPDEWGFGLEGADQSPFPFIFAMPSLHDMHSMEGMEDMQWMMPGSDGRIALQDLLADSEFARVQRWADAWGSRFRFEVVEVATPERPDTRDRAVQATATAEPATVETTARRSPRVVTAFIGDRDDPLGFVELSSSLDFGSEALVTMRRAFLLAAGGAMLAALVVGLLVSHRLSAPLRQLATAAGDMSGGDLSTRAPVRGRDEIGQLAGQFNRMAERLEVSFAELAAERDALRRFIADASHELRTPITALKNFNELLRGAAADDADARQEFLSESQVQLERLEWITGNLLDLSRLDAGLANLDLGDHDASELIGAAASPFRPLAREQGIALSVQPPEPALRVRCDRARLELALSNLLDNALKFTPAGGQVSIGAQQTEDAVQLWVRDSGPGIDPADQPHIFKRFYRGRANGAAGSGLGLAIVRSIVEAHGGHVSVESHPGEGSLFAIELPSA